MSLPVAGAGGCTELSASPPSQDQESLRRLPWCTCVSASAHQSRAQCRAREFAHAHNFSRARRDHTKTHPAPAVRSYEAKTQFTPRLTPHRRTCAARSSNAPQPVGQQALHDAVLLELAHEERLAAVIARGRRDARAVVLAVGVLRHITNAPASKRRGGATAAAAFVPPACCGGGGCSRFRCAAASDVTGRPPPWPRPPPCPPPRCPPRCQSARGALRVVAAAAAAVAAAVAAVAVAAAAVAAAAVAAG